MYSPWWSARRHNPVHIGMYEVRFYDGSVEKMDWSGAWDIPRPFIKEWRGLCG